MLLKSKAVLDQVLLRVMTATTVLIVALMPLHAFLSTWLGASIGPLLVWKSWKEILLVVLLPVVVWFMVLRPDIARTLWGRWVNKLVVAYTALHIVMAAFTTASTAAMAAGLMMNLRFFAIFLLVQLIVEAKPPYLERIKQYVPGWLLWTAIGLSVLAVLQVYVLPHDFLAAFGYNKDTTIAPYIVVDQNPDALRAFATMRGPNTLGAYLLMPIAVALFALYKNRRSKLAWAGLGLSVIALLLTGSRSAWLGAAAVFVVMAVLILPREHLKRWVKLGIIPAIIAVCVVGWAAVTVPAVRLAVFHSQASRSTLVEGSTDKHWQATMDGIADVVRHPLGSGVGSAGPASFYNATGAKISENYFVQIAQEVGILGFGLFLAINFLTVAAIVRRDRQLTPVALVASFAGLTVVNFFLHGWADDPTALTWWALAGLYVARR